MKLSSQQTMDMVAGTELQLIEHLHKSFAFFNIKENIITFIHFLLYRQRMTLTLTSLSCIMISILILLPPALLEYTQWRQKLRALPKEDTRQMERTISVNNPVIRQNKGVLLDTFVKNHSHQIPFFTFYLSIPSCFLY